jgi:DNA-binding CsgD family transcriptional regulator
VRTGFVGRARLLAEFGERLSELRTGRGSAVLVAGEPGMGKTGLLDEFANRASDAGIPVLAGRAVEDSGAPPYWPWTCLLDRAGGQLSPELLTATTASEGQSARFEVFARTTAALRAAAGEIGLVLVLDDLHWADELSLLLVRHVVGQLDRARLLLVGAYRDRDLGAPLVLPSQLVDIVGQPAVHSIGLRPLAAADVTAYLAAAADGPVDPSWGPRIHARSGGNALFVRELTRLLVQEGALAGPATDPPVPAELRRLLAHRLSRLSVGCRDLLSAYATIGDELDPALFAVLADELPPAQPLQSEAIAAGVLIDAAAISQLVSSRLRFAHSLLREVAYAELPLDRRVDWHRQLARALDRIATTDSSRLGERAAHWLRAATDPESARSALVACGDAAGHALARLAYDDAGRWYSAALDTLPAAGGGDRERAELLLELADVRYQSGQSTTALQHCAEVVELAERIGSGSLAATAVTVVQGYGGALNGTIVLLCERAEALAENRDTAAYARVLAAHARALTEMHDDLADALSRQALELAERVGDPVALAEAIHARHLLVLGPDGVAERLSLGARLRDLAATSGRYSDALWGHLWRTTAAMEIGNLAAADSELDELEALVERSGWPLARWHYLRARASRLMLVGGFAEADQLNLQAREIARAMQDETAENMFASFVDHLTRLTGDFGAHGFEAFAAAAPPIPLIVANLGLHYLVAGDLDRSRGYYQRARVHLDTLRKDVGWVVTTVAIAECAAAFDDREVCETCYRALEPCGMLYLNAVQGCFGSISRTLGVLAAALDQRDAAERHFTDAIAMERRIGSLPFLVLAQVEYARLLASDGTRGGNRARDVLAECIPTARRLGMAPALAAATDLAARLKTSTPLTRREREIATLVADGLSNREIAEKFVLSERTVETHVRSMLSKLGLTNRTHIAAWVARGGLA